MGKFIMTVKNYFIGNGLRTGKFTIIYNLHTRLLLYVFSVIRNSNWAAWRTLEYHSVSNPSERAEEDVQD